MNSQDASPEVEKRIQSQLWDLLGKTHQPKIAVSGLDSQTMSIHGLVYPAFSIESQSQLLPPGTRATAPVALSDVASTLSRQAGRMLEGAFEKYRGAVSNLLLANNGALLLRPLHNAVVGSGDGGAVYTQSTCVSCSGAGDRKCSVCDGTAAMGCTNCQGSGWFGCVYCSGQGYQMVQGSRPNPEMVRCTHCSSGRVNCPRCSGGKVRCTFCVSGRTTCGSCSGTRYQCTKHWVDVVVSTRVENEITGPCEWAVAPINRCIEKMKAGDFSSSGGIAKHQPTDVNAYATVAFVSAIKARVSYRGDSFDCSVLGNQYQVVDYNGLLHGDVESLIGTLRSTHKLGDLKTTLKTPLVQDFEKESAAAGRAVSDSFAVRTGAMKTAQAEQLREALDRIKDDLANPSNVSGLVAVLVKSLASFPLLLVAFSLAWAGSNPSRFNAISDALGWVTPLYSFGAYADSITGYFAVMQFNESLIGGLIYWVLAYVIGTRLLLPVFRRKGRLKDKVQARVLLTPLTALLLPLALSLFPGWEFDFATAGIRPLADKLLHGRGVGEQIATMIITPLTLWPIGLGYAVINLKSTKTWWGLRKLKRFGLSPAQFS